MNEEIKANYYAVIPASVRYDNRLNGNEKLLYGEITALSNRNGYCYAKNRYFADLYDVSIKTISRWFSNLQKFGFIQMEVKRNDNNEVIGRYIYIVDVPSPQKCLYPYGQKCPEGTDKNVQYNNIKDNKDDLFNLIINKSGEIPKQFFDILNRLELVYTPKVLKIITAENIEKIKDIIYVLFELYNSKFDFLIPKMNRESLLNLYTIAKEHMPDDLMNYYKRAIINKYTNNST